MEWLTQMLGMGNQQSSPFGALGGAGGQPQSGTAGRPFGFPPSLPGVTATQPPPAPPAGPPPMPGAGGAVPFMGQSGQPAATPPGAPPMAQPMAAAPQAQGGLPGLWGRLTGQQPQPGAQPQQGQGQQGTNNMMLGQAMNMLKQPQMQQPQWMPWMK